MPDNMDIQLGLWEDTPFGKTSPDASRATRAATSKRSSRNSSASRNQTPLMCLCLTKVSGPEQDTCMEWAQTETPFPWLGASMTPSGGASRKDGKDYACFATTQDTQQPRYSLTLSIGEKPRTVVSTKLNQILEKNPHPRFNLSPRACQGILRRAERRQKELPQALKTALIHQSQTP